MKGLVVGWTTAVVVLWIVIAALAAEDCSEGSILCFDFGAVLTILAALPALGVWLVGVCVISIVRRVQRRPSRDAPG